MFISLLTPDSVISRSSDHSVQGVIPGGGGVMVQIPLAKSCPRLPTLHRCLLQNKCSVNICEMSKPPHDSVLVPCLSASDGPLG